MPKTFLVRFAFVCNLRLNTLSACCFFVHFMLIICFLTVLSEKPSSCYEEPWLCCGLPKSKNPRSTCIHTVHLWAICNAHFGYKFNTTPNNNWPSASGRPCDIVVSDQSNNATRVVLNNTYASVESFNFCTLHPTTNSNIGIWLNCGVGGVTSGRSTQHRLSNWLHTSCNPTDSSDPESPRAVPTLQFHLSFLPPT